MREFFSKRRDEAWQELSRQLGAEFVPGGFWKGAKVEAHTGEWIITLDTHRVSHGHGQHVFTRLRAPYVNKDGFRFKISRKNLFTPIASLLGAQDIEIGDAEFDDHFVIKGNDEQKVRALFANRRIRELLERQPRVHLEVKDDEGWFQRKFPEGVDELYFLAHGTLKDTDQLRSLFDLFSEILDHLCEIGSAYRKAPVFD